jgi:hypothetical protein
MQNTPQYRLLQQAIDTKILSNKRIFILLKPEFTKDSISKFVRQFFGMRSNLVGTTRLTEAEREDIIRDIKVVLDNRAKIQQKKIEKSIQKDIYNKIKQQALSG